MPTGPKGQKRPADVIGNAVHVMRIATGEIPESNPEDEGKNRHAVSAGRLGGIKGGAARAANMTKADRSKQAKRAARARWSKGST